MTYVRRFNYQGPERLWDNLLSILQENIPEELALINGETGDDLEDFGGTDKDGNPIDGYLKAESANPPSSFILVQPDETDTVEGEDSSSVDEEHVFDITFGKKVGDAESDTAEQLTRDILRYDRAIRNVIWSMDKGELMRGITATPPTIDVRAGRVRWGVVGNVRVRTMVGVKLVVSYKEIAAIGV